MNQKDVAFWLDNAAERAEMIDKTPATYKQCWFLASLIVKANDEDEYKELVSNTSYILTKRRASMMIDGYLNG